MSYRAPVEDILATMRHVAGLDALISEGLAPELADGVTEAVLEEAAKFAGDVLAPLNVIGDRVGSKLKDGTVVTPPGWKEAYHAWAQGGWNALPGPEAYGGQALPTLVQSACTEMWNSAAFAFALGPLLTVGAIEALHAHGSDYLKETYLAKLVSGYFATRDVVGDTRNFGLTDENGNAIPCLYRIEVEHAGKVIYEEGQFIPNEEPV